MENQNGEARFIAALHELRERGIATSVPDYRATVAATYERALEGIMAGPHRLSPAKLFPPRPGTTEIEPDSLPAGHDAAVKESVRNNSYLLTNHEERNRLSKKGRYYIVGRDIPPGPYVKIYAAIMASRASDFLDYFLGRLQGHKGGLHFQFKFNDLGANPRDHNTLVMYASPEQMPEIVGMLHDVRKLFHPFPTNHPLGIGAFPGVSVVLCGNEGNESFDERLTKILAGAFNVSRAVAARDRLTPSQARSDYVERAGRMLTQEPAVGGHFRVLDAMRRERR